MKGIHKFLIAGELGLALAGCTDPQGAERALDDAGFTNVKTTGYRWFGCDGNSDQFHDGFEATNPRGKSVTGVVCGGWMKGKTIRFD
jgi:hypothetical protein